jgi:transcription elongation GreA/GreB family factor
VNKKELIQKVVAQLVDELELLTKAARAAHSEATHESSKAENKYDTRGLEASYLARGQSKQAAEVMHAIEEFEKMSPREFTAGDEIDISAVVIVESKKDRSAYFIGPRAGGTEVAHDGHEVLVITPQSPLGQQLVGRKQGDQVKLEIAGAKTEIRIASVT